MGGVEVSAAGAMLESEKRQAAIRRQNSQGMFLAVAIMGGR
jgi:hypothetical protein